MTGRFIYLVEAQNGLVKIGSSRSPHGRLLTIRLYCPVLVRLIAAWPAEHGAELALHALFREQRSHKEWFRIEGSLASFVAERRGDGVASIPAWSELTYSVDKCGTSRLNAERSKTAKARWADPEWRARWHERRQRHDESAPEPARASA